MEKKLQVGLDMKQSWSTLNVLSWGFAADQETPQDSAQSAQTFDRLCFKLTIVRLWPACPGSPSSCAKNAGEWLYVVSIRGYHSVDRDRIGSNSWHYFHILEIIKRINKSVLAKPFVLQKLLGGGSIPRIELHDLADKGSVFFRKLLVY